VDPNGFDNIATLDYKKADYNCPVTIKNGFDLLMQKADDASTYQNITEIFNLCSVPTNSSDVETLIETLSDSLGTMAMVDYPYPTTFVADLPAWPVAYSCD